MRRSNKGERQRHLPMRVLAIVLMLVLAGTTVPEGVSAQAAGGRTQTTASVKSVAKSSSFTVTDGKGNRISKCAFVGGRDSGQIPAQKLYVSGNGTVQVISFADWIDTSRSGNTVTIRVSNNYNGAKRSGFIMVAAGADSVMIEVVQDVFRPNMHGYGYLFGAPKTSTGLINSYKLFANAENVSSVTKAMAFSLMWETSKVLGVSCPKKLYFGTESELAKQGINASRIYGRYDADEDSLTINLTTANTPKLVAETVFHEVRHKWQRECNHYGSGRTQYLIAYGIDNYISNDSKQIAEVDAMGYAERMVAELNKKVK